MSNSERRGHCRNRRTTHDAAQHEPSRDTSYDRSVAICKEIARSEPDGIEREYVLRRDEKLFIIVVVQSGDTTHLYIRTDGEDAISESAYECAPSDPSCFTLIDYAEYLDRDSYDAGLSRLHLDFTNGQPQNATSNVNHLAQLFDTQSPEEIIYSIPPENMVRQVRWYERSNPEYAQYCTSYALAIIEQQGSGVQYEFEALTFDPTDGLELYTQKWTLSEGAVDYSFDSYQKSTTLHVPSSAEAGEGEKKRVKICPQKDQCTPNPPLHLLNAFYQYVLGSEAGGPDETGEFDPPSEYA